MRVVVREAAAADLDRIFAWIATDNPRAAIEMANRVGERVNLLAIPGLSHMGRPGLVAGTRELVEPPYVIVYEVHEEQDEIVVLAIFHGAQER
jgi:toxin ParE1/3/4